MLSSVTALRPDASPAMSPTVLLGPTTFAPPPVTPSSASYMSYGMSAPRPTKSDSVLVLFARFTGSSLASSASTTFTVYEPLAAVQVPRETGDVVEPAAMAPLCAPVRVLTVAPLESIRLRVIPWLPLADATEPWFFTATEKVTVSPFEGPDGEVVTALATRSELETGFTTSGVPPVKRLFVSFCSMISSAGSTTAPSV